MYIHVNRKMKNPVDRIRDCLRFPKLQLEQSPSCHDPCNLSSTSPIHLYPTWRGVHEHRPCHPGRPNYLNTSPLVPPLPARPPAPDLPVVPPPSSLATTPLTTLRALRASTPFILLRTGGHGIPRRFPCRKRGQGERPSWTPRTKMTGWRRMIPGGRSWELF
jgi:hypothetical protein